MIEKTLLTITEKTLLTLIRFYGGQNKSKKLMWSDISSHPDFKEDLIEKYKDNVNWDLIFRRENISKEFKEKYRDFNRLDNRYSMKCYWCGNKNKNIYYKKDKKPIIDLKTERYSCWYCPNCLR